MNVYTYETIDHKYKLPIKVFLTSINYSISHWHDDYEIIVVLKGDLTVTVSSLEKKIKAGDILLINCKELHEIESSCDNICLIIQLNELLFKDTDMNAKYIFALDSTNKSIVPKTNISEFIYTAAKIGFVTITKNSNDIETFYELKSLIYKFISDLFLFSNYSILTYNSELDVKSKEELFLEVLKYMDSHYKEQDVGKDICKQLGLSEKTLYRLLKSYTGRTLKDLVMEYKINNSKLLLRNSNKSLDVISYECGFSSLNTFFRQFKKHSGLTPNQYRHKNILSNANSNIQGYFDFDCSEGLNLLIKILEKENK